MAVPGTPKWLYEQIAFREAEIARLRTICAELLDIVEGQAIYDEFNKRYTHNFMSDGEALWRLLGLDDKRLYVPEEEFHEAISRLRHSIEAKGGGE